MAVKQSKQKDTKKSSKKVATYKGKSLKPGGGGQFAKLQDELMSEGKSKEAAGAIAATVGRKKYGNTKMAAWSSQGKKRAKK
jgi:hypothetical protein